MSLDPDQLRAVESEAPILRVLAGAGSGKTRVLTQRVARRIADESVDAQHTLVLTFTRKAADELRERLGKFLEIGTPPVVTGTFHAIAYAQLRRRWIDQGRTIPNIVSQPTRVISDVLEKLRMNRISNERFIAAELSWAKSRLLRPDTYIEGLGKYDHKPPLSAVQMQKIYETYELEKKKKRTVDYDDLLLLMTDALRTDKNFAITQQWMFRHFFVDEFQDLNTAQFELLRAWMGNREDLFVVGDANQAIYGWNGADSAYLNRLDYYYPQLETIELRTNYRSSKSVLAAAHTLIGDDAETPDTADLGVPPYVREFADEVEEAEGIARAARQAHNDGYRWSEIAILVRTNAQRGHLEAALEKFAVPYRSAGGAGWLYDEEVRTAFEYLRGSRSVQLTLRAPDIDEMIADAGTPVIGNSGGTSSGYMHQLKAAIQSCLTVDPTMTVGDFLAWVEVGSKQDGPGASETKRGAVTVTTFHRAKGLEWSVVFLAGLEDGLVPISNSDAEEERRLFYVAITRAREEVHLSWAKLRTSGLSTSKRKVSPWLAGVADSAQGENQLGPRQVHKAIDEGRELLDSKQVLHVKHDAEPARAALERWRNSRAKLSGVEANLILDDRTLDAIVDLRPSSRAELAEIDGFGAVRAANVGDELIAAIQAGQVTK